MKKLNRKKIAAVILIAFVASLIIIIRSSTLAQSQEDVVVNYDASRNLRASQERIEKNRRFNQKERKENADVIREFPKGVENLPTVDHWWVGLSALPVQESQAVVIGTVTDRAAYLSEDGTNIYSEFVTKLENVLLDKSETLTDDQEVQLLRNGGSVRFQSGKVQKYSSMHREAPEKDKKYLFFLNKSNGEDWFIITGYEISGTKVVPLDGKNIDDQRNKLPFSKYNNIPLETVLNELNAKRSELLK